MGQVCSGAKEESPKSNLLDPPSETEVLADPRATEKSSAGGPSQPDAGGHAEPDASQPNTATSKLLEEAERRKRRELWIVNGAARGMVAVRSTRGSTGYYDQGFAGLLAQHLEQTTTFAAELPVRLPPTADQPLYERLAAPANETLDVLVADPDHRLRGREAAAAVAGDPHALLDALAESLLDGAHTCLPQKQQLFAGTKPMVEIL